MLDPPGVGLARRPGAIHACPTGLPGPIDALRPGGDPGERLGGLGEAAAGGRLTQEQRGLHRRHEALRGVEAEGRAGLAQI